MNFNKKILIGVAGVKGSGKDTIADYLVKKYGFHKRSFADPLKKACQCLFGFTDQQVNGSDKEIPDDKWFGITPRETMQFVGTDLFRKQMGNLNSNIRENIFIYNFKNWYEDERNTKSFVVVPDVRFQNEVDYIRSQNGFIIKILYNATTDETSIFDKIKLFLGFKNEHESELQKLDYDLTVNNGYTCTFKELYSQIDNIIKDKLL
jgi:hypothetical protein